MPTFEPAPLAYIARLQDAESRSISAENPDGTRGGGGRAEPGDADPSRRLGKGWKVRPAITLPPTSVTELADVGGPGVITHIWITCPVEAYRDCVLRMSWDGEDTPSVEVPLGDFFALGHGARYNVNSLPVSVNPSGGMNCYWPMPFASRCRISIENQRDQDLGGFFYQIDYELRDIPDDAARFHAQWRRSVTQHSAPEHVILDGVTGRGHYVGTFLAWTQMSDGWWGEGEIKFFTDDDEEHPTICGTGTEDYFGGAWGFGETYSGPYLGYPFTTPAPGHTPQHGLYPVPKHSLYRWHVPDPIRFGSRLRVTIQALGWWPDMTFQPLADDIASVAYWYQAEPHGAFPPIASREERWAR